MLQPEFNFIYGQMIVSNDVPIESKYNENKTNMVKRKGKTQ